MGHADEDVPLLDTGTWTILGSMPEVVRTTRALPTIIAVFLGLMIVDGLALALLAPRVGALRYVMIMTGAGVILAAALFLLDRGMLRLFRQPWWWLCCAVAYVGVVAWRYSTGHASLGAWVWQAAFLLIFIGLIEELVFRGIIWDRLERLGMNRWQVLAISALLFLLAHAPSWVIHGVDPLTIVFQALWGVVFGLLRMVTRGLVVPVWGHALIDVVGM